jgi:hypothetical protein
LQEVADVVFRAIYIFDSLKGGHSDEVENSIIGFLNKRAQQLVNLCSQGKRW